MIADKIRAAADATDEATGHLANAIDAHKRGDARTVSLEHGNVLRCLRSAKSAFNAIAADAAAQDSENAKTIQTSAGTGASDGSDNGRAGSPLFRKGTAGISEWLDRARVGARR
jgi:hypothetical protein